MSIENIVSKTWTPDAELEVVFSVNHGSDIRTYTYQGADAAAIFAGADPANYKPSSDDGGGRGGTGARAEKAFLKAKGVLDAVVNSTGATEETLRDALGAFETATAEIALL